MRLSWFVLTALALTGCFQPGGGGVSMQYPDSVTAGETVTVRMDVMAFDVPRIRNRYRDMVLHYRLVGDSATFRTTMPSRRIDVNEKQEAYEFTIPPYPPTTCGAIELYFTLRFDGYANRADGHKKIRVEPMFLGGGAQDSVVVSPSCLASWTLVSVRSGRARLVDTALHDLASGSAGRPYARGLRLEVDTGDLESALGRTSRFNGVALADITSLRYRSYVKSQGRGIGAPFLVLGVDRDGDRRLDGELRFFPQPRAGAWQTWNALDGDWLARSFGRNPDAGHLTSWHAYLASNPNARLASAITIGAWQLGGSGRFDATVDRFEIGLRAHTTTFLSRPVTDLDTEGSLDVVQDSALTPELARHAGTTRRTYQVRIRRAAIRLGELH